MPKSWQPLDTAPEKTGPTRGERIFRSLFTSIDPFTPSSRLLLAAYRGVPAGRRMDTPLWERAGACPELVERVRAAHG
jgi:hypothetical protein